MKTNWKEWLGGWAKSTKNQKNEISRIPESPVTYEIPKNQIFDKNPKFSKSSKIAFFDRRLRLRRYLAQPHVHVLKVSYAVVLSYDFFWFSQTRKNEFGWVGGLTPRASSGPPKYPKLKFLTKIRNFQNRQKSTDDRRPTFAESRRSAEAAVAYK